jgi:hypothetical protein
MSFVTRCTDTSKIGPESCGTLFAYLFNSEYPSLRRRLYVHGKTAYNYNVEPYH